MSIVIIVSLYRSQEWCNAIAVEHMLAWWKTRQLISINKVIKTNTTCLLVIGNMRHIVKYDRMNPHRNARVNTNLICRYRYDT